MKAAVAPLLKMSDKQHGLIVDLGSVAAPALIEVSYLGRAMRLRHYLLCEATAWPVEARPSMRPSSITDAVFQNPPNTVAAKINTTKATNGMITATTNISK